MIARTNEIQNAARIAMVDHRIVPEASRRPKSFGVRAGGVAVMIAIIAVLIAALVLPRL